MPLVTRTAKGSPLTTAEMDSNLTFLKARSRPYANVAAMQADTDLQVGDLAQTVGYYSAGDGGGATYEIVSAGTGTADGGGLITLTNNLQARAHFPGNVVRISQFGATSVVYDPVTTPSTLGCCTDAGAGAYRLVWNGTNPYTGMRFTTIPGSLYTFSVTRLSALPGIVSYDGLWAQSNGAWIFQTGLWGNGTSGGTPFTATGAYIQHSAYASAAPMDVTFSFRLTRRDSAATALTAALAWFGTTRTGRLIIDIPAPLYLLSAVTVPSNVEIEVGPQGALNLDYVRTMIINSRLIAENRPILPKNASVTFGPRQSSVKSNWFGL